MISYADLCEGLRQWRVRNNLPVPLSGSDASPVLLTAKRAPDIIAPAEAQREDATDPSLHEGPNGLEADGQGESPWSENTAVGEGDQPAEVVDDLDLAIDDQG